MASRPVPAPDADGLTVGATARAAGITVRTLHHWDAVGLVRPSARTPAGYRVYTASDLARVHRVALYRELDVPLEEIRALLDAPEGADASLRRQRDLVRERQRRLGHAADALDRLVEARERGVLLPPEEQVALFGDRWQPTWAAGARERWGDTDQWAQFAERAAERTPEQWQAVATEAEAVLAALADAMGRGVRPGSDEADTLAERHRASLGAYFDVTHAMHVVIARMYASEADFAANHDAYRPGLTAWLREVVDANARAHGVDPATATWE
ncbi:MerR family transcriptional regulator [Krasilnikoviella flava]|uniref:DNA-binding transcriptional regulator, MerR family n=1 Tax=Krasilnikoviella flava TaxID=526729 RepID=A0A1T5LJE1_9MICO|nr:MerR family transcriptional regulator [Krasilnikoviella flava]SKC76082.1 DNA-binding transcriptional regulator, MerR family [Krasilnikoviella flava]